jgi:hypothetical protein
MLKGLMITLLHVKANKMEKAAKSLQSTIDATFTVEEQKKVFKEMLDIPDRNRRSFLQNMLAALVHIRASKVEVSQEQICYILSRFFDEKAQDMAFESLVEDLKAKRIKEKEYVD